MADISKIKSLDGTTTYNIKDATAQGLLNGHSVAKDVPSDAKFTDTTYSSKSAASGGTDVSLVTTGEKYTWNNKGNGTITGIKMNGSSKGSSGVVDLGTVITAHQDISDKMNASLKGAANGVAELDSNGKVPSSQLPSYVDDVLEYDSQSTFPTTGETGKIYVAKDTNKTYRWSGTAYVEISPSLALGETSSTAYRGDRGKTAYDHSQSTHARTDATAVAASSTNGNIKINGTETTVYTHPGSGTNPHGTTKSDVGLGNVGNFKAVSTVASQGLTDTEKSNARANIGAGTSSLALGTSSSTAYRGDRGNSAYAHAVTNKGSAFASGLYKITTNSEGHVTAATAVEKADITGLGIPGSDTNTHRPIQVNGTEVLGNNTTALNLKAGSNVTVTNSSGTVTIAATDTTYSSKTAASGGTDVSLVTTGEKYTWNNKGSYSKPSGGIPDSDIASAAAWNAKASTAVATTSADGLMSSGDKTKLNGIASGAEVNQNAFSNVVVGSTTIAADGKTDTLTLVAGSNVTLTPDATNDKVTIAATDTTYSSKSAASGGTDVSLVTTGEKYTWNNKGSYSKPSGGIPDSDIASASTWNAKGTYSKPSTGIPKTDLASAVQTSLGKADSALQSHQTIKQDGVTGATVNRFGTCSTAAGTAAKAVSITTGTFSLEAGAMVAVKFSNANTAGTPTLNVNSSGAKNIFVNGAQITTGGNKALLAGTVIFLYDGTQWHLIGNYYDTNTQTVTGVKGNSESSYRTGNVNITAANIGAATSGHTHTTTIASDSGTNQLTLAASTKYKLTAGGTSYIFTTPPNTTYSDATTSAHGLMTAADKTKLNALVNLGLTLVGSV